MIRSTLALVLVVAWAVPSMGGVVKAFLEPAPGFSNGNFGRVYSSVNDPAAEYAPLLVPGVNEYPNSNNTEVMVSATSLPGGMVTGAGSSRINGRVTHTPGQVGIYTTAYSVLYNPGSESEYNLVAGRVRVELDATDYTWAVTNPAPETDRTFVGFLSSDDLGVVTPPALLLGGGTYYFHFSYRSSAAQTYATALDEFINSSRSFELVLTSNSVAAVPEPASMAIMGTFCVGGLLLRRRRRK